MEREESFMKKRILSLLIAGTLLITSCSEGGGTEANPGGEDRASQTTTAVTAESPEPAATARTSVSSEPSGYDCWICEQPEARNHALDNEEFYLDSLRALMRLTSRSEFPSDIARITAENCSRRPINTEEPYDCRICEQPEVRRELETGIHYGAVNDALLELSQHGTPIEEVMQITRNCNLFFGVWFVDRSNGQSCEDNFFNGIFVTEGATQRAGINGMSVYSFTTIQGGGSGIIDLAYGGSTLSPEEDAALHMEHFGSFSLSDLIQAYPMLSPNDWFARFPEFSREEWVTAILEITPFMWEARLSERSPDEWVSVFSDHPEVTEWAARVRENSADISDVDYSTSVSQSVAGNGGATLMSQGNNHGFVLPIDNVDLTRFQSGNGLSPQGGNFGPRWFRRPNAAGEPH
jgi:hypothetical protein